MSHLDPVLHSTPPQSGPRWRRALTRGISRNVVALGLVSLFTDISSEMLVYVIPLYLANVLLAPAAVIGLIEGVAESTASVLKLISGALSDRLSRRRLLVGIGYSTSVVAKVLYLAAVAWPVVLLGRVGDRFGKGIRTSPRDALIADSTAPEYRGAAYGLHRAMDTTGAFAGVLIAAAVIWAIEGNSSLLTGDAFRILVLLALVPGLLAIVTIFVGVRDVTRVPAVTPAVAPATRPHTASPPRHPSALPDASSAASPSGASSPASSGCSCSPAASSPWATRATPSWRCVRRTSA